MVKFNFNPIGSYDRTKLLKNFKRFITENYKIEKIDDALKLFREGHIYTDFINCIFEGIDTPNKEATTNLLIHQRKAILDSIQEGGTDYSGFLVITPLIVIDIMSKSELIKCAEIIPIDKSELSIEWIGSKCRVRSLKTGKINEYLIPRVYEFISQEMVDIELEPNKSTKLFDTTYGGIVVTSDKFRIDRDTFRIVQIDLTNLDTSEDFSIECSIKPDGRYQLIKDILAIDSSGNRLKIKVFGNLDIEKGIVTISATVTSLETPPVNYKINKLYSKVKFIPTKDIDTRPTVVLDFKIEDVRIDVTDDFKIENIVEVLQDMKSLYNVDLMETLIDVVTLQMNYNSDGRLYYCLKDHVTDIQELGLYDKIDISRFRDTLAWLSPNTVSTIFTSINPRLIYLSRKIFDLSAHLPIYIICNSRLASVLESLQDLVPFFESYRVGKLDMKVSKLYDQQEIKKDYEYQVLTSPIIPNNDNRLYIVSKSHEIDTTTRDLEDKLRVHAKNTAGIFNTNNNQYVLVNFVYKPIYIVSEVTHGKPTVFVRSRKTYRLVKPEACGILEVIGLENLISETGY